MVMWSLLGTYLQRAYLHLSKVGSQRIPGTGLTLLFRMGVLMRLGVIVLCQASLLGVRKDEIQIQKY
jgi:hypothetical protein